MIAASLPLGKAGSKSSYYIRGIDAKVGLFNDSARSHFSIESSLRWVMDVVFGEDSSRIHTGDLE